MYVCLLINSSAFFETCVFVVEVANTATKRTTSSLTGRSAAPPSTSSEPLQLTVVEVLRLSAHRSGGLQQLELQGQAMLRCCDPQLGCVQLHVSDACNNQQLLQLLQLQTHPQLDKQAFRSQNMLRLKHADKPFPVNVDVGVLRSSVSSLSFAFRLNVSRLNP